MSAPPKTADDERVLQSTISDFVDEPQAEGGPEGASVDVAIGSSNVGFKMLKAMGWKETGLGRNETGLRISTSHSRRNLHRTTGTDFDQW